MGLSAVVLGARWLVVYHYSTDLPEWDQWDAEGVHLLSPWFRGEPLLPALFTPQNEHYIVVTKLVNLAVTALNGKWDQRLECVVNAFLPAALAVGLFAWSRLFVTAALRPFVAFFLAAAWGLPLAWQNIVSGLHSAQFFLIGLSAIAILLLPFSASWSLRWWIGAAATALALLTMASGMFAGATILLLFIIRMTLRRESIKAIWPGALVALTAVLVGWFSRHEVDYHLPLRAKNFSDFALTIMRSLHWPASHSAWFGLILWLPWVWTGFRLLRRPHEGTAIVQGWTLFGFGTWIWLQLLATGYARGAGGPYPSIRYFDTLILGCCVNFFTILWLWLQGNTGAPRWVLRVCGGLWIVVFGCGTYGAARISIREDLPRLVPYHRDAVIHTRAYLATRDRNQLVDPIPYPGVDSFLERINQPGLSRLMPASVRPSILLEPARHSDEFELRHLGATHDEADAPEFQLNYPRFRRVWKTSSNSRRGASQHWASTPIRLPQRGGRLVFDIFGELDGRDTALELRDASSDALLASLRPLRTCSDEPWKLAAAPLPAAPFIVHARTNASERPFAFAEPVVMPIGSYVAWRLSAHGGTITTLGLVALLLGTAGILTCSGRETALSTPQSS